MHFRPLHPLLRFPKGVGFQTVSVQVADPVRAIGFRNDREPRRCRDGLVHGRVWQRLIDLLPPAPLAAPVKRLVAAPSRSGWPGGWDDGWAFQTQGCTQTGPLSFSCC